MPNAAIATPAAPAHAHADAERAARQRDAEIHARVFGHAVRLVHALGCWEYEAPSSAGTAQWYPVPLYGALAEPAERLRTRVTERGYEVGLFREACPPFAEPLGGRTRCLIRSGDAEVARGEASGPAAEARATAAAVRQLTEQAAWHS